MEVRFDHYHYKVKLKRRSDGEIVGSFYITPGANTKTRFAQNLLHTLNAHLLWMYVQDKDYNTIHTPPYPFFGAMDTYYVGDGTCEGHIKYIADIVTRHTLVDDRRIIVASRFNDPQNSYELVFELGTAPSTSAMSDILEDNEIISTQTKNHSRPLMRSEF
jgi:hypothetical protein